MCLWCHIHWQSNNWQFYGYTALAKGPVDTTLSVTIERDDGGCIWNEFTFPCWTAVELPTTIVGGCTSDPMRPFEILLFAGWFDEPLIVEEGVTGCIKELWDNILSPWLLPVTNCPLLDFPWVGLPICCTEDSSGIGDGLAAGREVAVLIDAGIFIDLTLLSCSGLFNSAKTNCICILQLNQF